MNINNDDAPIPSYLIIKVNTRIKNARKITYEPKMSDRKTSAQRVLFDPLIELKKSAITENPFFSPSLFELAKDKSLRSHLFGQKKKTLKEAVNSGYIENNVSVTLDTLFKKNAPFYVNNKAYKVHSYIWDKKWELAKRPYRSNYTRYNRYRPSYSSYNRPSYRSSYRSYRPYNRSYNRPYTRRRRQYGGYGNNSYIYVNIYLELYPPEGTAANGKNIDCMSKYERLKLEWASLMGTEYRMDGSLD
jgi:hypothetical protein